MKIIFSKDFKDKLKQPDQKIIFDKYFIKTLTNGENILSNLDLFSIPGEDKIEDLHSIWDNELKLLFLSLSADKEEEKELLLEKENTACISIMYSSSSTKGVAFLLVGDNTSTNIEEYIPSKLNFSTIKNLVNIDFSNIEIIAEIDTNQAVLTDSTKILEESIDVGNNIYLLKSEDNNITITVDSFKKKLYQVKCSTETNIIDLDFLKSDTGERVYRNMILRVYDSKTFFPRLVGDVIVIDSNDPSTLGLSSLGGELKIVGTIGYNDYLIQNNKITEFSSGYQNISEIANLVIKTEELFDDVYNRIFPELSDLVWNKKNGVYKRPNGSLDDAYGNKLILYLPTIILNTGTNNIIKVDLFSCKKEFKLIQSNRHDPLWSLRLPDNIEIGYEYESVKKGLSLYPVPVIIFESDGKTKDGKDSCNIKLDSTRITTLDSNSFNVSIKYEYADGYGKEELSSSSTEYNFKKFFEIIFKGGLEFEIKCKEISNSTPPNLWIPYDYDSSKQLLIKAKLVATLKRGNKFLNGSDTFETPFYVVRKPKNIKTISVVKAEDKDFTEITNLYLSKEENSSSYKSGSLAVISNINRIPDTVDYNNIWILNNPNLSDLYCNLVSYDKEGKEFTGERVDYGTLTLDTSYGYEYSDKIKFTSIGDNFNLKNITFNYLDRKIFGEDETINLVNNFDINDWKSTILMPKISLGIIKESSLTAKYKDLVFDEEENQCEEVEKVATNNNDSTKKFKLTVGRLGDHEITINSDRSFSVIGDFIDGVSLVCEENYLGNNSDVSITLRITSIDLSELLTNILGTITIKQSENCFLEIEVATLLNNSNYLKNLSKFNLGTEYYTSPIDPIINRIFLSGYEYRPNEDGVADIKDIVDISRDNTIKIKYHSPITTITTGTVMVGYNGEDENNSLLLGTTYDENKGWKFKDYLTDFGDLYQGFYIPEGENPEKEIIMGSTVYKPEGDSTTSSLSCSSKLSEDGFYKYPVPKLGELRTHILGTNKDYGLTDELNYSIYKRGLRPGLYNTYNGGELKNASVYVVDNTVNSKETDYHNETIYYAVDSLYPLSTNTGTDKITTLKLGASNVDSENFNLIGFLSLQNTDPFSGEYLGWGEKDGDDGWTGNKYKEKLKATNFIPIDISRKIGLTEDYIMGTGKYPVGSFVISHFIPNDIITNDIEDNQISIEYDTTPIGHNEIKITSKQTVTSDVKIEFIDDNQNKYDAVIIKGNTITTINRPEIDTIGTETKFYINKITPHLDENYNYCSKDYYDYIEKPVEAILDIYWVGTTWAEISMDTSAVSVFGETRQLTLNKPHIYPVELIFDGGTTNTSIGGYDADTTKNNSTIDFTAIISRHGAAIDLLNKTEEPINLEYDFSGFYSNYSKIENITSFVKFKIDNGYEYVNENGEKEKGYVISQSIYQEKFSNSIFYRDKDIYNLFIKGDSYCENIENKKLGNIKKEVDSSTESLSLTMLGISIDELEGFKITDYKISGKPVKIECLNEQDIDVIFEINSITELTQGTKDNIVINFPQNYKNQKREIPLRISYEDVNFVYTIIQDVFNPELKINGNPISVYKINDVIEESNRVLGFHSSGNFLNNEKIAESEFGYIVIEAKAGLGIYNETTELLNLSMVDNNYYTDFEHYVIDHFIDNKTGNEVYKVLIKISPNYSREERTGSFRLNDMNDNVWYIGFIQGYITAALSSSDNLTDEKKDYNIIWDSNDGKFIGMVGTSDNPIPYPHDEVIVDPYFYVKIIQKEVIYDDNYFPQLSDEYLISSNYSNISMISNSERIINKKYTTVTYHADPWTSPIENGITRVFREGSYDTDLYYYPGIADYYPRLIHRYRVSSGYGDDDLIFNIQTKFAISRYKKYLHLVDDTTDNLDSDILYLDTTPLQFSFWLIKVGNKIALPIELYEEGGEKIYREILFNGGSFEETKRILVKFTVPGLDLLNGIDIITSDNWIDFSLDYVNNIINVTCDVNTTGKERNGVITITPKDSKRWSGIKSLDIRQLVPETALMLEEPKITLEKSDTKLELKQYSSVPLYIKNYGFITFIGDDWIRKPEGVDDFFDRDKYIWSLEVVPSETENSRVAKIKLYLEYKTSLDDEELKTWSDMVTVIQNEPESNTTTTTTTTTTTSPPIDTLPMN